MVRRGRAPRIIPLGLLSLSRSLSLRLSLVQDCYLYHNNCASSLSNAEFTLLEQLLSVWLTCLFLSLLWLDFKDFVILSKSASKVTVD